MIPALLVPSVRPRAIVKAGTLSGFIGGTQQFTLRQYQIGGGYVDSNAGVSWSSSNPSVATIDASGLATLHSVATAATITATIGGRSYTSTMPAPDGSIADVIATISDADIIGGYDVKVTGATTNANGVTNVPEVRGNGLDLAGVADTFEGSTWLPTLNAGTNPYVRTNSPGPSTLATAYDARIGLSQTLTIVMLGSAHVGAGSAGAGVQKTGNVTRARLVGSPDGTKLDLVLETTASTIYDQPTPTPSDTTPRLHIITIPPPLGASALLGQDLDNTPLATVETWGMGRAMLRPLGNNTWTPFPAGNCRLFFGGEPFDVVGVPGVTSSDTTFLGGWAIRRVLNDNDKAALKRWATAHGVARDATVQYLVKVIADSRSWAIAPTNPNTESWPFVAQASLGSTFNVSNRAVAGDSAFHLATSAASPTLLAQKVSGDKDPGLKIITDIWLGVNDNDNGRTIDQFKADLRTIIDAARIDSDYIVVKHETNKSGGFALQPGINAYIDQLLAQGVINKVVHLDSDTRLMDTTNATYFDGAPSFSEHYTTAGEAVIASLTVTAYREMLGL